MAIIMQCSDNTEKVCIQTNKVFDACLRQETFTDQTITVTGVTPSTITPPLTYGKARSSTTAGTIRNLTITPQLNSSLARITGIVDIPLTVTFTDSLKVSATGSSTYSVPFDIMLTLPQNSVMPYNIESVVSASSQIGTYVDSSQTGYVFSIDICVAIILKIVMQVELIVASYGYAVIPPCTDFSNTVCEAFFDLPLYPATTPE